MPKKSKGRDKFFVPQLPDTSREKLKFSFEYYDTSNKYCLSSWTKEQIKGSLARLKDISSKSFNLLKQDSRTYHFNEVIWEKTIEKNGFPDQRTKNLAAFHFALLGVNGQLARIYGAYSQGTFYIVWFDLNHDIWPTPLKYT